MRYYVVLIQSNYYHTSGDWTHIIHPAVTKTLWFVTMHQALQDQITGVGRYAAQESRCGIKVGTVCKLWQQSVGPNATPGPSINSGHSLQHWILSGVEKDASPPPGSCACLALHFLFRAAPSVGMVVPGCHGEQSDDWEQVGERGLKVAFMGTVNWRRGRWGLALGTDVLSWERLFDVD